MNTFFYTVPYGEVRKLVEAAPASDAINIKTEGGPAGLPLIFLDVDQFTLMGSTTADVTCEWK